MELKADVMEYIIQQYKIDIKFNYNGKTLEDMMIVSHIYLVYYLWNKGKPPLDKVVVVTRLSEYK